MKSFAGVRRFWSRKRNFGKYEIVMPTNTSPIMKLVPGHIQKPNYYKTGDPGTQPVEIDLKSNEDMQLMRQSCQLAASILRSVESILKVGVSTEQIDQHVHQKTIDNEAYPSPLNYRHFTKSVCTSVNNVACHGIPDKRPLADGDIINVDVTVFLNGFHGDCSKTFLIGEVDEPGVSLVNATSECLDKALNICKPGTRFRSLGAVIEETARSRGYNVVPCFTGHGIGTYFHGPPDIYHFSNFYPGEMLAGMTFTIEPILTQGKEDIIVLEDDWTAITADNARTAQFEHTCW